MVRNYDASRQSLYQPGAATDFFEHGIPPTEVALCAEMSRLAYVKEPARLETYLARAGFALQQTLGYGTGGTQVFMATATDASGQETLLVAFRGTEGDDWDDLQTDANCRMVAWQAGMGKVHAGFAAALQDNGVLDVVRDYVASKPAARVLLTGHSLGAALATLAASIIHPAYLYTFGCPRVGDKVFAEALRSVRHQRYVDCCDLVTDVPPEWLGYVHVGELHYIARNGQVLDSPDAALIAHDRRQATLAYWLHYALLPHNVWVRRLADHAPINYVTALR
ncbi:MAG: lipase family protein [Thiothrix sp.]|uniref:lipase family protein n=1 Tax=Thiothrix sp. TaxID=1032 RepID=UPI0026312AC1|nr:lipase family protein [Thiothrix sp.]MDD5394351.1 lipase family protein [Thiothrix sp.]